MSPEEIKKEKRMMHLVLNQWFITTIWVDMISSTNTILHTIFHGTLHVGG
jgi:hypothetical protein